MSKIDHLYSDMRILIACDKFKDSLTAAEACKAIASGIHSTFEDFECIEFPLADGGDGTMDILTYHSGGEKIKLSIHDPLFRLIESDYGLSKDGKTAFIEMANSSGLKLLKPEERNTMITSTFGTGELIGNALDRGVDHIILGIGGSATTDGGIGLAAALGFEFLDSRKKALKPIGKNLALIESIDNSKIHPRLHEVSFTAICDVDNLLHGDRGAAHVYGPQKGATPEEVRYLDKGLKNLARVINEKLKISIDIVPGAGAGGGVGGGAIAFLHAELKRGVDLVLELSHFEEQVKNCDAVITGEGKMDEQTLYGKLIHGIATKAKKYGKRVIAVTGRNELSDTQLQLLNIEKVFALTNFTDENNAMKNAFLTLGKISAEHIAPFLKEARIGK